MSDRTSTPRPSGAAPSAAAAADYFVDRIDRRILATLQVEGRLANQALAERVGLSPSAVLQRVRRLELQGLIRGYRADIDVERLQSTLFVFAEVTLASHFPDDFARFEAAVASLAQIVVADQISGPFDYLLQVAVPDINAWRALADHLLGAGLGVAKITTSVRMKAAKTFSGFDLG